MSTYILKRFLQLIPVFLGATLLVYFLVFSLPGDPIVALFGDKPVNEAVAAKLRMQYHLDQPFWMQYLLYLKSIFTFDLGQDFSGRPIAAVLGEVFPVTARLAVMALIFEGVFGIIFVLGFLLQFTIGVQLGWAKPTVSSAATVQDLILPAIVLGLASFAYVLRLTRTSVIENMSADYVRTATAKGLSRFRVVRVHILRNSLIPVITFLGADLGSLMGGAIVTEGIFNVPGVGNRLYRAVTSGEGPTVVSIVTVLVLIYCVSNLLVDLLYAWLDPRIRYDS